jgi:hypothetical protein|tara:strand:- start:3077 stop:4588 length:1512 start_codon:yes stop_codon:yes gene_type:complete
LKNNSKKKNLRNKSIIEVKPSIGKNSLSTKDNSLAIHYKYYLAIFFLLALLLFVFFFLPNIISNDNSSTEVAPSKSILEDSLVDESEEFYTEEEVINLRSFAEKLLSDIIGQHSRISILSPDVWANDEWLIYLDLISFGDDAFLSDNFQDAIKSYERAIVLGEELLETASRIVQASISYGNNALNVGDHLAARNQFEVVLKIEKNNSIALDGLARAENLPEVLEIVEQAREKELNEEYVASSELYRQAIEIDSEWQQAKDELDLVLDTIEKNTFDNLISNGYSSLGIEDFDDAHNFFSQALLMRSNSEEAKIGILQAEQGQKLDEILLVEARAFAFERRELWENAISQYEAILGTDPNLEFAKNGLMRSRLRDDLDKKLSNLIENPRFLFDDEVLEQAEVILLEALSVNQAGARITEQADTLKRIIELASTPVNIVINSDGLTNTVLYRKGSLGRFDSITIKLRPGNYTIVGNRNGYRDVRINFDVLPEKENMQILVSCTEEI